MRQEAHHSLSIRPANEDLTRTSIRSTSSGRDRRAVRLIDKIFGPLQAVYGDPSHPQSRSSLQHGNSPGTIEDEWIAKEFYANHFCPVKLQRDNEGAQISDVEFIEEVSAFHGSELRNKVFFLQGTVGSGKTAFINYLISKYGKTLFNQKRMWFVRVNIDVMRDSQNPGIDAFLDTLTNKLRSVIGKLIDKHSADLTIDQASKLRAIRRLELPVRRYSTESQHIEVLCKAISSISRVLNRRLFLVVDNMDYIVHERDRYQFLSTKEDINSGYLSLIRTIVSHFYQPDSDLSDIAANVLFVLRPDTYNLIKTTHILVPVERAPFVDNRYLYNLKGPSWDDVVSERASLLSKCLEQIRPEGVAADLRRHTEPLIRALHDAPTRQRLFRHLREISVYGLRGVLSFYSDYTWYPANVYGEQPIITTRFIQNYQLGLLGFMLNNRIIYTQNEANFPNIYFININSDEESEVISNPIDGPGISRSLSKNHWHTYWLKRLLLEFIKTRNNTGAALKPDDVYHVFCSDDNDSGYTEDIIRLCLGGLSQSHLSDLIKISWELTGDGRAVRIENIRLSGRALHYLENLFDTFPYLQLIVDDYMLPVPSAALRDFTVSTKSTYSYLTMPNDEFMRGARDMIAFKADRVTRFLAILAESMDAENLGKPRLFSRLRQEGVHIPDAKLILEGVFDELKALSTAGVNVDTDTLRTNFEKWRHDVRHDVYSAYGVTIT